ncbi:MAG: hypothetical protein K2N51_16060 [Lachnospiraceae bacterium]|nr:hypothetical protein [Lachnospiraceae bacterium]
MFYTFYREDIVKCVKKEDGTIQLFGNAAELSFLGMSVSYDDYGEQTAIKLDQVNPRYFSEMINQLEMILKGTKEDNGDNSSL